MEKIQALFQFIGKMQLSDYADIMLVTVLIFLLLPILRSNGAGRIFRVIVSMVVVYWLTGLLQLHTIHFLIDKLVAVGVIALVVLYQPELRRMLDHVSNVKLDKVFGVSQREQEMVPVISQVIAACEAMSREKVGALIVFERDSSLSEYMKTGTIVDAAVSDQLLRNIFFPKAALHDGAVIIRNGRLQAASCVLPLTDSDRISADLGTRHRAAIGTSTLTDAVVVVVSEETGAISVSVGGILKRYLAAQTLDRILRAELCPPEDPKEENIVVRLRQMLQKKGKGENGNDQK